MYVHHFSCLCRLHYLKESLSCDTTKINKMNNHISPQPIKHNKDNDIGRCRNPGHGLGQAHENGNDKPANEVQTRPFNNWM